MGKLEREIRKRMKQSAEPYEVWAQKHSDELAKIAAKQESQTVDVGGVAKAKRRVPVFVWLIGAGIVLLTLVLTVSILLSRNASQTQIPSQPQIPDLTFGEDAVSVSDMSDEEIATLVELVPQFSKFNIVSGAKTTNNEGGSLVMYTLRGEYETPDDFYLIEARVLYDNNFAFLSRLDYENLQEIKQFGDTTVNYQLMMKTNDDIYLYYALSESDVGKVYWRIESFEGLFDEWLEETFS